MTQTTDPSILAQPVSDIQLKQLVVEWVKRDSVKPNAYNPNHMAVHERFLLRQSLLEDGWTQPVVTLLDGTIVDGEQRWTTAGMDLQPSEIDDIIAKMELRGKQGAVVSESIIARLRESRVRLAEAIAKGMPATLASITGGLVPITRVDLTDEAHRMISTIRHNRARGVHDIDSMSVITQDLVKLGLDFEDLETRLGMPNEEIERFLKATQSQADELAEHLAIGDDDFSAAWQPTHVSTLETPQANVALDESAKAAAGDKAYEVAQVKREADIRAQTEHEIAARASSAGAPLTQTEKAAVRIEIEKRVAPAAAAPTVQSIKRFSVFLSPIDFQIVMNVLGDTQTARVLVALCKKEQRSRDNAAAQLPAAKTAAS